MQPIAKLVEKREIAFFELSGAFALKGMLHPHDDIERTSGDRVLCLVTSEALAQETSGPVSIMSLADLLANGKPQTTERRLREPSEQREPEASNAAAALEDLLEDGRLADAVPRPEPCKRHAGLALRPAGLDAEALAPFSSPAAQNGATPASLHAHEKTVGLVTVPIVGLVRSLHVVDSPSIHLVPESSFRSLSSAHRRATVSESLRAREPPRRGSLPKPLWGMASRATLNKHQ